jgi:hypothetical protein
MAEFGDFLLLDEVNQFLDEIGLIEADSPFQDSFRNRRLTKQRYLDPKTNKSWRAPDRWRQLKAVISHETKVNGVDPKKIWITFSDVPKLGQRMAVGYGKSTPVGIFSYPVKYALEKQGHLAFQDRPYMHVFKTNKPHFEVGRNNNKGDTKQDNNFKAIKNAYNGLWDTELDEKQHKNFTDTVMSVAGLNKIQPEIESYVLPGKTPAEMPNYPWVRKQLEQLLRLPGNYVYTSYSYGTGSQKDRLKSIEEKGFFNPEQVVHEINLPSMAAQSDAPLRDYIEAQKFEKFNQEKDEWEYDQKYVIGPNWMISLTPNFVNYLNLKSANGHFKSTHPDLIAAATNNTPFPVTHLEKVDHIFSSYYHGGDLIRKMYAAPMYSDPKVIELIKMQVSKIAEVAKQFMEKPDEKPVVPDIAKVPYADKLTDLAGKFGVDLNQAVADGFKSANSFNNYLYRATKNMAKQYGEKHPEAKWTMVWNKMLRQIGISGVADTRDSGNVHSAESTQGAFLDPRDIQHIATIVQKSHSDYNDPASRPPLFGKDKGDSDSWDGGKLKQHSRLVGPTNQRVGQITIPHINKNKTASEKTYLGLTAALRNLSDRIPTGYYVISNNESQQHSIGEVLAHLIKLVKLYNRYKKQGSIKSPDLSSFETILMTTNINLSRLEKSGKLNEDNIKRLNVLRLIMTNQGAKTPTYKKPAEDFTTLLSKSARKRPAYEPEDDEESDEDEDDEEEEEEEEPDYEPEPDYDYEPEPEPEPDEEDEEEEDEE